MFGVSRGFLSQLSFLRSGDYVFVFSDSLESSPGPGPKLVVDKRFK